MVEMILHSARLARHIRLRYLPKQLVEPERQVNLRTRHDLYMLPEKCQK